MIALSARCLARAWCAVRLASSDDENRPSLYRAVNVLEYPTGVRLVACDSFWMAWCWVPAYDELVVDSAEVPAGQDTVAVPLDEPPVARAVVLDTDHRVLDMMRHLHRVTSPKDSVDQPVDLDLHDVLEDENVPTLMPELAKGAARFQLASLERLLVATLDGPWLDWLDLHHRFAATPLGTHREAMSTWMIARIARVASQIASPTVEFTFHEEHRARWQLPESSKLYHRPEGLAMYTHTATAAPSDTDDAPALHVGDVGNPAPVPGSPSSPVPPVTDLDTARTARRAKRGKK